MSEYKEERSQELLDFFGKDIYSQVYKERYMPYQEEHNLYIAMIKTFGKEITDSVYDEEKKRLKNREISFLKDDSRLHQLADRRIGKGTVLVMGSGGGRPAYYDKGVKLRGRYVDEPQLASPFFSSAHELVQLETIGELYNAKKKGLGFK
jgi:hypothetical protein